MRVGIVLGAGGPIGWAYHLGVIEGIRDAIGRDPAHVIGTMASIAHRADQEFNYDLWGRQLQRDHLSERQGGDLAVTDVMTLATWAVSADATL